MTFATAFPSASLLLGPNNVRMLESHSEELAAKSDEEATLHFDSCVLRPWCQLYTTPECRDELATLEICLKQILDSPNMGEAKFRRAFSHKAANPDQFDQLYAEIATAATVAMRGTLVDLEWKTGKKDFDADVRMELDNQPVNLEVTLRTDGWVKAIAVHMEEIFDPDGNQVQDYPAAKSRRTLTERQWADLTEAKLTPAIRISDVIETRKNNPSQTGFVSEASEMPKNESEKSYCADGDNLTVESRNVQRCIQDKAKKFNADGFHIVVLATFRLDSPTESSVFDALYGQFPQIKHHGLFETCDGVCNVDQICGVIYLPVYQHLSRLHGQQFESGSTCFFLNHNAKYPIPEELKHRIANLFEAKIRIGWKATDP